MRTRPPAAPLPQVLTTQARTTNTDAATCKPRPPQLPRSASDPIDLFVGANAKHRQASYFAFLYQTRLDAIKAQSERFNKAIHPTVADLQVTLCTLANNPGSLLSSSERTSLLDQAFAIQAELAQLQEQSRQFDDAATIAFDRQDALALSDLCGHRQIFEHGCLDTLNDLRSFILAITSAMMVANDLQTARSAGAMPLSLPPKEDMQSIVLSRRQQKTAFCAIMQNKFCAKVEHVAIVSHGVMQVFNKAALQTWLRSNPERNVVGECFRNPLTRTLIPIGDLRRIVPAPSIFGQMAESLTRWNPKSRA